MGKGQYQGGRLGSQGTYHPNNEPIGEVAGGMGSLQAEYFTVGHQWVALLLCLKATLLKEQQHRSDQMQGET